VLSYDKVQDVMVVPALSTVRAIVTDLDGTLLRSDGTVSSFTHDVLSRLCDRGYRLIFATARPKHSALRVTRRIAPMAPVIYSNGAAVYDPVVGRTLRTQIIPAEIVQEIVYYIRRLFPRALIAVDCAIPANLGSARTLDPDWPPNWGATAGDRALWRMDSNSPPPRSVICLMALNSWDTHLDVPQRWPVTVTSSGQGLIEFSALPASKLSALRWLFKRLGISMEMAISFGDMPTDADILAATGIGVAVANAHELAKAAAQYITKSNDEDGVALFLASALRLAVNDLVVEAQSQLITSSWNSHR
jgi:hydroxymethylpyrimidine pyrophosphatase-like HAD family hydrolase